MAPKAAKPGKEPGPNEKCDCPGQPKQSGKKAKKCCYSAVKLAALAKADPLFAQILARAAKGDAHFQYIAGCQWERPEGDHIKVDETKALGFYLQAAEQGHSLAQYNCGIFHSEGRGGVSTDYATAASWYRKSATQGYVDAQYNLGNMLRDHGSGAGKTEKDTAEAIKWFGAAAKQGDTSAKNSLALMKLKSNHSAMEAGNAPSVSGIMDASMLLMEAAEAGGVEAQATLAQLQLLVTQEMRSGNNPGLMIDAAKLRAQGLALPSDEVTGGKAQKDAIATMKALIKSKRSGEGTHAPNAESLATADKLEARLANMKLDRACDMCGKTEEACQAAGDKLRHCSNCKLAKYCSTECMAQAWGSHEEVCDRAQAELKGKGKVSFSPFHSGGSAGASSSMTDELTRQACEISDYGRYVVAEIANGDGSMFGKEMTASTVEMIKEEKRARDSSMGKAAAKRDEGGSGGAGSSGVDELD